jgi:hypothetical protein
MKYKFTTLFAYDFHCQKHLNLSRSYTHASTTSTSTTKRGEARRVEKKLVIVYSEAEADPKIYSSLGTLQDN